MNYLRRDYITALLFLSDMEQMSTEEFGAEGSMKHIRLDNPVLDSLQSPSRSPMEFEKKQLEIIELWHSCNISLVHRTYFFLLFKGDPSDFIYLEVELRRLTFLKNAHAHGDSNRKVAVSGLDSTMVLRCVLFFNNSSHVFI